MRISDWSSDVCSSDLPVITWGSVPMLPHTMNEGTFEAPNGTIQGKAARWEGEGRALAASVFTGFNLADVPDAALSVVVVTAGDSAGAQAMTDRKSVVWGKSVSVRVNLGGGRTL